jgi:uncharacterized RDD family membrane protein YckC
VDPGGAAPPADLADVQAGLRLGWHIAELRGRHDPAALREPLAAVSFEAHALRLGDELSPAGQALEVESVIGRVAAALLVNEDIDGKPVTEARLADYRRRIFTAPDDQARDAAWLDFAAFIEGWDEQIQCVLAAQSSRLVAAYRMGRGYAEIRWALHGDAPEGTSSSWSFLLGAERRDLLIRLTERLSAYFDPLTPAALIASLRVWYEVAENPDWRQDALTDLQRQSEMWHDLILADLTGDNLLHGDPMQALWYPYRLLPILGQFKLETVVTILSVIGLGIALAIVLFAYAPHSAQAGAVTAATHNAGGPLSVGGVVTFVSLVSAGVAWLMARTRASVHDLTGRIRQALAAELASDAATIVPAPPWPPPPGGNPLIAYGGFWERLLAQLIDAVIVLPLQVITFLVMFTIAVFWGGSHPIDLNLFALAATLQVSAVYYIGFWGLAHRTLGMMPFNLYVVRTRDGGCVGVGWVFLRALGVVMPAWAFYLALFALFDPVLPLQAVIVFLAIWLLLTLAQVYIAFDSRKQALHDKLARSFVIKTRTAAYDCESAPAHSTPLFQRGVARPRGYAQ